MEYILPLLSVSESHILPPWNKGQSFLITDHHYSSNVQVHVFLTAFLDNLVIRNMITVDAVMNEDVNVSNYVVLLLNLRTFGKV